MALSPNHKNWCNSEVEVKDLCQDKTRMEFDFLALNGESLALRFSYCFLVSPD